jgi:hypothetical protein
MECRYAVLLQEKKIGTVKFDPDARGSFTARMAPLPAFRRIAYLRRLVNSGLERDVRDPDTAPTIWEAAELEGAAAVLENLRFVLFEDITGSPFPVDSVELLDVDPPRLTITR